jgi:hypothetical protein
MIGGANIHLAYVYIILTPNIAKRYPPFLEYIRNKTSDMESNVTNPEVKTVQMKQFDELVKINDIIIVVKHNIATEIYKKGTVLNKKINDCPLFYEPEKLNILGSALIQFTPVTHSQEPMRETLKRHPIHSSIVELKSKKTLRAPEPKENKHIIVRFISIHRRKIDVQRYIADESYENFIRVGENNVKNAVLVGEYTNTLLWIIIFAFTTDVFNPNNLPVMIIVTDTPYKKYVINYLKSVGFVPKDEKIIIQFINKTPNKIPTVLPETDIPDSMIRNTLMILLDIHTLNYLRLLCYSSPTSAFSDYVVYKGSRKHKYLPVDLPNPTSIENAIVEYGGDLKCIQQGRYLTFKINTKMPGDWETVSGDVAKCGSPYTYHTHPISVYDSYNVLIGPPSTSDWMLFWTCIGPKTLTPDTYSKNSFHVVATLEGIYVMSIRFYLMSKELIEFINVFQTGFFMRFEYPFHLRETKFWTLTAEEKETFSKNIVTQSIMHYKLWLKETLDQLKIELLQPSYNLKEEHVRNLNNIFRVNYLSWKDAIHPFDFNGTVYRDINPPWVLNGNVEPNDFTGGEFELVQTADVLKHVKDAHDAGMTGNYIAFFTDLQSKYSEKLRLMEPVAVATSSGIGGTRKRRRKLRKLK